MERRRTKANPNIKILYKLQKMYFIGKIRRSYPTLTLGETNAPSLNSKGTTGAAKNDRDATWSALSP